MCEVEVADDGAVLVLALGGSQVHIHLDTMPDHSCQVFSHKSCLYRNLGFPGLAPEETPGIDDLAARAAEYSPTDPKLGYENDPLLNTIVDSQEAVLETLALAEVGSAVLEFMEVRVKFGLHTDPHPFRYLGKLPHYQLNVWRAGVKGSDYAKRIPLPWCWPWL